MTYEEALAFIDHVPKFSPSVPGGEIFAVLKKLLHALGDPHQDQHYVHIGGTNGKGSAAALMASILEESGLKVGIYTSPALFDFTERICIGKQQIAHEELADLTAQIKTICDAMAQRGEALPNQSEIMTAIALTYFRQQGCDISVLEVGLGGRRDATNVIAQADLTMMMTISLDHTEILGDTLVKIAGEKAGIIKEQGTVLLYPQPQEVRQVFRKEADKCGAQLIDAALPEHVRRSITGQSFDLDAGDVHFDDLHIRLLGTYQVNNAAMAVQGACLLRRKGYPITEEAIRRGCAEAVWAGRFELMRQHPAVIVDGGHNEEGARVLAESLQQYFPGQKIRFVVGVLADKDYTQMLTKVLAQAEAFYTITPPTPRALPAEKLADWLHKQGAQARAFDSVEAALAQAIDDTPKDGCVCVFGSLYYLGEVRKLLISTQDI